MIRIVKIVLAALLLGGTFGTAHAQTAPWTVSEVSGRVTLKSDKGTEAVSRGEAVHPGAVLETGPGARAVIVRGRNFVTVAPNSRVRVPAAQTREAGLFDVLHEWGNAIFQIEKRPDPHFSVGTPYLAAVVKGTTFSITVSPEGTSLQVTEGAVETSTLDGGARDLIKPGIVAIVSSSDRYRLTVQGQDAKTIDSPQRPAADAQTDTPLSSNESSSTSDPTQASGDALAATAPAALAGNAGAAMDLASAVSANAPSHGMQMILDPVMSEPANLSALTGGLVGGTTASQAANVQVAFARDAVRREDAPVPAPPGSGNGSKNGNGPGDDSGPGNGDADNPGNGNGPGEVPGNGNGGPPANVPGEAPGNGNSGPPADLPVNGGGLGDNSGPGNSNGPSDNSGPGNANGGGSGKGRGALE